MQGDIIPSLTSPAGPAPGDQANDHEDELSPFRVLIPLIRERRTIARWILGCAAAALLAATVLPVRYKALASFTMEQETQGLTLSPSLSALAGQFGIPSSDPELSPDFYVALIEGRTIARILLSTRFLDSGARSPDSTTGYRLIDLLDIHAASERERWEKGIKKVHSMLSATIDRKAGIVTLTVEDGDAMRAAAIANTVLDLLNRYNVEQRQFRSRQQRQFAERRLAEARKELRETEQRQLEFLTSNRTYSQSPVLSYELAQLQRAVEEKQEVVLTLTKAYEEARIAEARDIPVLTVVDRADPPVRRSFPVWWKFLLVALIAGAILGTTSALLKEANRALIAAGREDYLAFRIALHDLAVRPRWIRRRRA